MLYRDISSVSILGLRGTLYVQRAKDAEGVTVQTEGPYEAKVVDDTWLMIYPEGQEPQFPQSSHADITLGQTDVGSVDVEAKVDFLASSRQRMRDDSRPRARAGARPRPRARASVRVQAAVQITAPPKTKFELIGCQGLRKGPGGWHLMRGYDRFDTR